MIQIDLGAIECNTGVADTNGVQWFCAVPKGWQSAALRGGSFDPTGRDGAVGLANWWGGRQLTIPGKCRAPSSEAAWDAYNFVISSLPGIRDVMDVVVHEPGTPKGLTVVQHGEPEAEEPRDRLFFTWQLSVRADNPFKVAQSGTTTALAGGGSTTLTNAGNTAAYPIITTTSSGTVDLVIGGRHFTTGTLPSGAVIDMWERTLVDGSGDPLPAAKTPESEWLALPVGTTGVDQDGTAGLSFSHFATFN